MAARPTKADTEFREATIRMLTKLDTQTEQLHANMQRMLDVFERHVAEDSAVFEQLRAANAKTNGKLKMWTGGLLGAQTVIGIVLAVWPGCANVFDQLKELIAQFLDKLAFMVIVEAYEGCVVLRFGKYHRTLEPGLHFVWPLMIEKVLNENIVPRIYDLNAQSLTTTDGKSVVVSGNVLAQIKDVQKALLGVEHVNDAIKNVCVSEIARAVTQTPWQELTSESFGEALTAACRKRGWKWGIEIMEVQLSDVAAVRSLRLFHDNSYKA